MDLQSSKSTEKSNTNNRATAGDEARTKLGQEALGRQPQRNSEGEASAPENILPKTQISTSEKPSTKFNGTLTSPDGNTQHQVIDGNVVDAAGNSLGSLDANGKVKTSEANFADTAVNSAFKDYVFVGIENGNARSFVCDQKMCSGKIFLPDGSGKNIEHEVRLGMIINKSTGKQIGLLTAPEESQDGHLYGGQMIVGEPPQQVTLSACAGVVFDLKVEGQTGVEGRRLQGISLGMDQVGERDSADRFLNLQDARVDQQKIMARSLSRSEENSGLRPIDWLSGAQETNENTYQQERETAKRNINLYDRVIQTGQVDDGLIKSLEGLSGSAKTDLYGRADKPAVHSGDDATIAIPAITQENLSTVNGRLRVGDEVYEIKQGDLYKVHQNHGGQFTDTVKSGRLEPGYIMQIEGRPACSLASENRVLMEFTVGDDSAKHQLIGLGARRHTDAIGFVPGGLVDVRELARQTEVTQAEAAKANLEYFNNRPYVTGRLANWAMGDREAILSDFAHNIERQKNLLGGQTEKIFASGFSAMSNNQLDRFVASVQLIAHNIGATGASGRQLAQDGQKMQQMVADSATIAAITVATAGAGAVISGAVNAGRIGVVAAAGAELAAGAGSGAAASTILRASNQSDWRANALGGAIEGGAMAFGSAGGKLFGNMAQLGSSQAIASELRTGARIASSLSRQEQMLLNTVQGKLALAGYSNQAIKSANLGYKVADSVVQTTAFSGSHAIRTGDTTHFNSKAISLGSSAMLLGMGVGHGLDRTIGRITTKAETAFAPAIGQENSALLWRAEQSGIGRRVANDTVNAYTNGAAASVGDALERERERVAQELRIEKHKLTNELFWRNAKLDNVLLSMHESGTIAAATAPGLSIGSHLLVSQVNRKIETVNRTEISSNHNQPEQTIRPIVNEHVAILNVPQEGTRLSIDGRNVLVIATNPNNGEIIVSGREANHLGTAVALEPPLQLRRSQTDGWTRYDNLKGCAYYKNPDGKFYKVLSEAQGQLLLLADYQLESVSQAVAARQQRTSVEPSQSRHTDSATPDSAELNHLELPNGIVAIKSRLGKWIEIYPAGHPKEHQPPTEANGIYMQGANGEIIKRTPIVDVINHPDGRLELKHNPDFVQVIVPAGARPPSNAFITRVNNALMNIPSQLRLIVEAHGGRVKMSSLSTDVRPQLRGEQPRGHRRGNTWSMVPGFHDPINHDIVIAERRRIDGSYHQRMVEPEAIVYHEFGHAADSALGNFSEHPDFVAAYERDLAASSRRMTSSERAEFDYFIQLDPRRPNASTHAGRQELFAEMFAGLMGRTSIDYNRLRAYFPSVEALMQRKLAHYGLPPARQAQRVS